MKLSLVITTFEYRFDKYLVPLIKSLAAQNVDGVEIVVTVNGENGVPMNKEYRSNILRFCSEYPNVYPVMFPMFRGLSKLWNTGIVHTSGEYVCLLNDDISVPPDFIQKTIALIDSVQSSFLINSSYSHFVVKREEIDALGYFDERLLGIGEEDGDFAWRYISMFNKQVPWYPIDGINNYVDGLHDYKPTNIRTHSGLKYSLFNRAFIYEYKYEKGVETDVRGFFDYPMTCKLPVASQYPYEKFYIKNKKQL